MAEPLSFEHGRLLARYARSRHGFYRALAGGSPRARIVALDGVEATAIPVCPWSPIFNCVFFYEDQRRLEEALPSLARSYSQSGVVRWSVSVPADDRAARELLELSGFTCTTSFVRMADELATLDLEPRLELDLVSKPTWEDVARCNDRAYRIPEQATMGAAFASLEDPTFRLYAARLDGDVVTAMFSREQGGDAYLTFGATVPEAQRKGIGRELVRHALRTARERGCRTATGETTPLSTPMCLKLGTTPLGALELWEHRTGATREARGTEAAADAAPAPSSHRRPPG